MTDPIKVQAIGMAWYREDEYPRLRKAMTDGHVLHLTYSEWLKAAKQGLKRYEQSGIRVIRADLKLGDFLTWCASLNIKPDSQARTRWGSEAAYRVLTQERGQ